MNKFKKKNIKKIPKLFYSTLYIVPTPIGNLQDITYRALIILKTVDYIIVENMQRAKTLLKHFSIYNPLYKMNRYNEHIQTPILLSKLREGKNMALISDAGTPLINDPGYRLVHSCHKNKIKVIALPGPCAAITALCGSGLPTNRFCFEGFLPAKKNLRINKLKDLLEESRTLIFYDVKYRIIESLKDMIFVFGPQRYIVLARELSKIWESIYGNSIEQLLSWIQKDKNRIQGELILIVSGYCPKNTSELQFHKPMRTMQLLASELSVKKAAVLTGYIYGIKKNLLYKKYLDEQLNMNDNTKNYLKKFNVML